MTAAIAAMVTAVVGVFGTLSAPILGQFMTGRQNREKNRAADTRRNFEELRAAYTAMNRASREFHTLLKTRCTGSATAPTAMRSAPRSRASGGPTATDTPRSR